MVEVMKSLAELANIPTVATPTPSVNKIVKAWANQWQLTADACIARAEELERAALDLRERARVLISGHDLADEVINAVRYEIEARNRALSLSLVKEQTNDHLNEEHQR